MEVEIGSRAEKSAARRNEKEGEGIMVKIQKVANRRLEEATLRSETHLSEWSWKLDPVARNKRGRG